MIKKGTILFLILISIFSFSQQKKKVLFIGNSYTYVNNLPQLLSNIALSKSDSIFYDSSTPGGSTFSSHCLNSVTWQKIRSQKWDVVVLQAQSQEPSYSPANVMSQVYPFAKQLTDSIRANNACTEVMFFMTWGRKNADMDYCSTYTPVCTYNGMQARLRESYMMFKDSFMTSIAPVGVAWKTFRNSYPLVDLYSPDESHPSLQGSYLAACVFYSSIFKKTTVASAYNPSLPVNELLNLQTIAASTVLDSMEIWNLESVHPKADFTYSVNSQFTYAFTNNSKNANSFSWSFGSAIKNPQYTFPGAGTYTVQLKAFNSCSSDSIAKTVSLTGIKEITEQPAPKISLDDNIIQITFNNDFLKKNISIFSSEGKLIFNEISNENTLIIDKNKIQHGLYILSIISEGFNGNKKIIIN